MSLDGRGLCLCSADLDWPGLQPHRCNLQSSKTSQIRQSCGFGKGYGNDTCTWLQHEQNPPCAGLCQLLLQICHLPFEGLAVYLPRFLDAVRSILPKAWRPSSRTAWLFRTRSCNANVIVLATRCYPQDVTRRKPITPRTRQL